MIDLLPYGLAAGMLKAVGAIPAKRKEWYEGTAQKKKNDLTAIEIELKQLELEAKRQEVALRDELVRRIRATFTDAGLSDEEAAKLIDEHVLPALRDLGEIGITDLLEEGDRLEDE